MDSENRVLQAVTFPIRAVGFVTDIFAANLGMRLAPSGIGWTAFIAVIATGAAALTLTRSLAPFGDTLGWLGVAAVSYVVGALVDLALRSLFNVKA
ncbi:MAG: hypothetical protein KF779_15125 [Hyphomonadaceae bacterium]|nr:hypothetical protein [Hyphomonadaceae bacterium]